jgi:hypothetical protein
MDIRIVRQANGVLRARERAQSVVEVVLAATALLVAGAAALGLYTGALQQAFTRLVTHVNGI